MNLSSEELKVASEGESLMLAAGKAASSSGSEAASCDGDGESRASNSDDDDNDDVDEELESGQVEEAGGGCGVMEAPTNCNYKEAPSRASNNQSNQQQFGASQVAQGSKNNGSGEYEEVKQVELFGVRIVALTINGKERLCLAQISNTLLKEFSYNEIHNRRVALGITCIQCTPIQLEMLRRAGAMPSSSRRCGMITMREAERLCRSFLVEEQTPELPENFYFTVAHRVNYGCKGRFVPARYISSRAKCIECFYCGEFYSPNKFIFHSHRQPHATDCNPPDSPNINSWRKHIDLDWTLEHSQEIKYAWEDVKSLFNGGTRRRATQSSSLASTGSSSGSIIRISHHSPARSDLSKQTLDEDQIDVDDSALVGDQPTSNRGSKVWPTRYSQTSGRSLISLQRPNGDQSNHSGSSKRLCSAGLSSAKRFAANCNLHSTSSQLLEEDQTHLVESKLDFQRPQDKGSPANGSLATPLPPQPFNEFVSPQVQQQTGNRKLSSIYPTSSTSNFIYSQLYNQLMQPQQANQQHQHQQLNSAVGAQLALRHQLWSSLLANLQCSNTSNQTYSFRQPNLSHCSPPITDGNNLAQPHNSLSHLIYSPQLTPTLATPSKLLRPNQSVMDSYKSNRNDPFTIHKFSNNEANDV